MMVFAGHPWLGKLCTALALCLTWALLLPLGNDGRRRPSKRSNEGTSRARISVPKIRSRANDNRYSARGECLNPSGTNKRSLFPVYRQVTKLVIEDKSKYSFLGVCN